VLPDLRGVRGERALIRTREVSLRRPVQLLHPRIPLYIVPWDDGVYMIGATVIESEDRGPVSVRSALELLGGAYAVHPAFAEAEVLDLGAGIRPAFPDNVPRAIVRDGGQLIYVNGAYRHGFLLGPVLARAVADYIESGAVSELVVGEI
jgi:glycine oxidase